MTSLLWMMGPLFVLGDSMADPGNFAYLFNPTAAPPFVVQALPTYSMYLGKVSGEIQAWNGHYIPPRYYNIYPEHNLGRNYAIAGSGWDFSTQNLGHPNCLVDQMTQLLADHPNGFKKNTVILISIGENDALEMAALSGSAPANSSWTISGNQTIPNAPATMAITVANSAGVAVGNNIAIPSSGGMITPVGVTAVTDTSISFAVTNPNWSGLTLADRAAILPYGAYWNNVNLSAGTSLIAQLIANGATIVLTNPPDVSLLPSQANNKANAHAAWLSYCAQLAATYGGVNQSSIRILDIAPFYSAVYANPTAYGFKDMTTEWVSNQTLSSTDLFFYDGYHPTSTAHRAIFYNVVLPAFLQWGFFEYQ